MPLITYEPRKLYVVVRDDLSPGLRLAQAGHAIAEVVLHHPNTAGSWNGSDNYLIVLGVPDEAALRREYDACGGSKPFDPYVAGIPVRAFYEPDLGGAMTAFAALPHPFENHRFSHLPLSSPQSRPVRLWRRLRGQVR